MLIDFKQESYNFSSDKKDFALELMTSICGKHNLDTYGMDELNFKYDGIKLPTNQIAIGKISYGTNVAILTENLKSFSISLPITGTQKLYKSGGGYISNSNVGLIVSNTGAQELQIHRDCEKYQIAISESSMHSILENTLGFFITEPIVFDPVMDLKNKSLEMWWSQVCNFWRYRSEIHCSNGLNMWAEDYEKFLIKSLLLNQSNNFTDLLKDKIYDKEYDYVEKIRAYIEKNACRELNLNEIIAVANVSRSKLYFDFHKKYGLSPFAYLRKYRLHMINKYLTQQVVSNISIAKVAYDWGFNHLSRFSKEYRLEFGESPSETRKKIKKSID